MSDVEDLVIRWGPYPQSQQEACFDNDTPDARKLIKGGFGSGKTMTLLGCCFKLSAINAPHTGMFVVPKFEHWEDTILETIRQEDKNGRRWFLEDSDYHVKRGKGNSILFQWAGGGDWLVKSAMTRIVGANMAWAATDEPGLNAFKSWKDTIARVRNPAAPLRQVIAGGTPEGLNWLSELFGQERADQYFVYSLDTRDNVELMASHPAYVQDILRTSTEQEAAAYVQGEFRNLEGVLVYLFDRARHYREDLQEYPHLPLRITFDFNVDPMSAIIGQEVPGPAGVEAHVIDAVVENNSWTPQTCEEIVRRYGREASARRFGFRGSRGWPGGAVVYGDATGNSRSANSNKTNFQWIKEILGPEFPSFKMHESVSRGNPGEKERTDAVNVMLGNALGQTRLFVRKRPGALGVQQDPCYPLVRSFEQTIKAPGTDHIHKPAGETHTHPSDACGYWICAEFPVLKPISQVGTANPSL